MTKTLCLADETRILNFLHRAGLALNASSWKEGQIGLLAWHRKDASEPSHRARNPELAVLADEFYGPFVSEAVTPDTFESMSEAFLVMLDADAGGNVPFYFRTFAHLETSYWELTDTPLAKLATFPIFGLYMIREGDPYRYGDFLQNVFCYAELPDDAPKNQYGQNEIEAFFDSGDGSDMERSGDGWERIDFATPAEMDASPNYSERYTFVADPGDLTFTTEVMEALAHVHSLDYERNALDAIRENLATEATENAREYFAGNAVHPKALLAA